MDKSRILKGLLWIVGESGGLGPGQLDKWLGELVQAGYVEFEPRGQEGEQFPFLQLTEKGRTRNGN
ncbi:hypothetical protein [Paenibacillus sp. BK720]|uniref:hypothetical protein n=1 Tax=Paenibacillus sp. BK720 TaxID=2587092 RepID=UPI001ABA6BC3|nr:hypothetical protein [Paenibacillus sp. BK720]